MHTLTIKVHERVLDKIVYFLDNLPKQDIEIISNQVEDVDKREDFISFLAHNPIKVEPDLKFFSREEVHER